MTDAADLSQLQREVLIEEARRWLRWADTDPSQRLGYPPQAGVGRSGVDQLSVEPMDPAGVAHGGVGHAGLEGAMATYKENQTFNVAAADTADYIRQFAERVLTILGASTADGTAGVSADQI
jgi:hypothetical protein